MGKAVKAVSSLFGGGGGKKSSATPSVGLTGALPVNPTSNTSVTTETEPLTSTTATINVPATGLVSTLPVSATFERAANDFVTATPTAPKNTLVPETQTTLEVGDLTGVVGRKKKGTGVSSVLGF